jgi:hypothetical protein
MLLPPFTRFFLKICIDFSQLQCWSTDASYSVCSSGAYVVSGSSRNGVVRIWDTRSPSNHFEGLSVYACKDDNSPVFDVVMENRRIWGITDKRFWMAEFGQIEQHSSLQMSFLETSNERLGYYNHGKNIKFIKAT